MMVVTAKSQDNNEIIGGHKLEKNNGKTKTLITGNNI